ncbi:NAD-dependent epimerase/dehydratase family protein [Reichenbachiella sp. MALMAid0571]|uniref:NAD-dependent epimerase/dehydratase family protein n=1 Tax=Reichenbachiella sp. MALMAid0571 TaxID=3143939 RepID=UPI0032DEE3B1
METILVIGASGQLGSVLTNQLQIKYGAENVVASDLRPNPNFAGNFVTLDATDFNSLRKVVREYKVDQIYHLAAILSASGEKFPLNTWDINMKTFFNVLEVSRLNHVSKVFFPSSIAVFGQNAPKVNTPQSPPLFPSTVYGISKVAGENWAQYYHQKYRLDIRSLRYPGIIGYQSLPGGGTTDYAVDIFHKAVQNEPYECFLKSSTMLPMIYMDDAIRATIELMDAPLEKIKIRTSYNLAGMSFSPAQLTKSIQRVFPDFQVTYKPDFRQEIAESWPMSIDDSVAIKNWGWKPAYNLNYMVDTMIKQLELKYQNQSVAV